MQLKLSGHHIEITDSLREYVHKKFKRLEVHNHNIISAQVTLTVENNRKIAEANLHVKGADVFASSEHEDMYAAIDSLIDKLDRQLIKDKEKHTKRAPGH